MVCAVLSFRRWWGPIDEFLVDDTKGKHHSIEDVGVLSESWVKGGKSVSNVIKIAKKFERCFKLLEAKMK